MARILLTLRQSKSDKSGQRAQRRWSLALGGGGLGAGGLEGADAAGVAEDGVVGDSGAEVGGGRLGSVGLSLADVLLAVVLPVGDDEDLASCLAERLVARAVDLGGDGAAAADDACATAEAAWAHLFGKAAVDLAGLEGGGALVALGLARRGALVACACGGCCGLGCAGGVSSGGGGGGSGSSCSVGVGGVGLGASAADEAGDVAAVCVKGAPRRPAGVPPLVDLVLDNFPRLPLSSARSLAATAR